MQDYKTATLQTIGKDGTPCLLMMLVVYPTLFLNYLSYSNKDMEKQFYSQYQASSKHILPHLG